MMLLSSPCPCCQEGRSNEQTELEIVQDNMATLSTSFATLMEQKTKMEATYQADKKKVMVRRSFVNPLSTVLVLSAQIKHKICKNMYSVEQQCEHHH